jgi:hypothetical protein
VVALATLGTGALGARQATRTEPVTGLRANATGFHALVGARVVTAPGQVLDNATIVIRNGLITAVGDGVAAPAGARAPVQGQGDDQGHRDDGRRATGSNRHGGRLEGGR